MNFNLTATSDLWSKPSPVTPRSSAPLGAALRITEGMWWLQTLLTVWALWNLFPLSSFLLQGKVKKYAASDTFAYFCPLIVNPWKSKQHTAKALTLTYFLLYCCAKNCLNVCLISVLSSYFHSVPLIKLSPTAVPSFLSPPSTILCFSHWSAVGLENRPRAIANASIFGHVDGTRGMRLTHNPPSNTLPFLPPSNPSILSPPPPPLPSLRISSPSSFFLFIASCLSSLPNPNPMSRESMDGQLTGLSVLSSAASHESPKGGTGWNMASDKRDSGGFSVWLLGWFKIRLDWLTLAMQKN